MFRRVVRLALIAGLLVGAAAPSEAQTAADLFNDREIHEVRLFINSRDLAELKARFQENVYFPADMVWRGLRVRNAGVRVRGLGSRNTSKLGLLLDFDYYTEGQQFLGLGSLVLDNLWQDPSLIREALSMSVFRRMGQPAPRESFARLYINNEYQGVYTLVEPVDPGFVARAIGDGSGYLFEFRYTRAFYTEFLGEDLAEYEALFEARSREKESDIALYGPIRELFREVNGPDDAVWRERVDGYIDLPQMMTHAAIQAVVSQIDGLLGYVGVNNLYLYRPTGSSRHRLFPWDEDVSFSHLDSSVFRRGDQPLVIFERALQQADLRAHFLDAVEQCARIAGDGNWLLGEVDRLAALISQAAIADTRKQFSNDDFLAGIAFLRDFATSRPNFVLAEIGRAPIAEAASDR